MKTVQYQGQSFEVPDWAKYIAADYPLMRNTASGVWVYEMKPEGAVRDVWDSKGRKVCVGVIKCDFNPAQEIK